MTPLRRRTAGAHPPPTGAVPNASGARRHPRTPGPEARS